MRDYEVALSLVVDSMVEEALVNYTNNLPSLWHPRQQFVAEALAYSYGKRISQVTTDLDLLYDGRWTKKLGGLQ